MAFSERPLALGGFFRKHMAGTGFSINDFTGARFFKPFGSRPICFDFGHVCLSFYAICFCNAKYRWREQLYSGPRHLLIDYSRLL
jgi:hypothetical protein